MSTVLPDNLRASLEGHFQLLNEGMQRLNVGVSIYDDNLRLIVCNRAFGEILDLPAELVQPGAALECVIHLLAERGAYGEVDADEFVRQALAAMQVVEEPFTYERRTVDGRVFESHTSRLLGGGYLTLHTDITHHKEAEARLRESQYKLAIKSAELELILDNASLGIATVEPSVGGQWLMRRVNRALAQLLGYAIDELEGRGMRLLFLDDAEYARVAAAYAEIVLSGRPYHAEHIFTRKNGSTLTGILRGSAIDPADPGRGAIWLIEDISERKHIQAELIAKTALLQAGTEHMPGAMAIWDENFRYLWWTPRGEEFFNLPPGTLKVGLPLAAVVRIFAERGDYGPGDIEALVERQMQPFYQRKSVIAARRMPDGRVIESRRNPLPDGGYVSVFQDITAHQQMQEDLRQAKEAAESAAETLRRKQKQVKALLDSSGQGFLSFAADLRVQDEYSQACTTMLGEDLAGKAIDGLLFPDDGLGALALHTELQRVFAERDPYERSYRLSTLPREFLREERILLADFRALDDGDVMLVLTDVTAERRFMALSNTDRLTGLANRRRLDEALLDEIERAARTQLPMAVILADIDHFKQVNDTHGHLVGDRVLVAVAGLLRERVRKVDKPGRWGGEEFMVICPDTDREGAYELAEQLRLAIGASDFGAAGKQSCSFGVAALAPGETAEVLLRHVDEALYEAKRAGRNRVCKA